MRIILNFTRLVIEAAHVNIYQAASRDFKSCLLFTKGERHNRAHGKQPFKFASNEDLVYERYLYYVFHQLFLYYLIHMYVHLNRERYSYIKILN